jgi:hypothetical protein
MILINMYGCCIFELPANLSCIIFTNENREYVNEIDLTYSRDVL